MVESKSEKFEGSLRERFCLITFQMTFRRDGTTIVLENCLHLFNEINRMKWTVNRDI